MKVGENPKMPYPQCGRSMKTYARGNNDAPSITKYGSPVWLDAQIVALRPHCTRTALRAPPNGLDCPWLPPARAQPPPLRPAFQKHAGTGLHMQILLMGVQDWCEEAGL